jgi:hypothetical protein
MKKLLLFSTILLGTVGLASAQQGVSRAQMKKKSSSSAKQKATESKTGVHLINATDQQVSAEKAKKATIKTTK